jgi:hypothetical protein
VRTCAEAGRRIPPTNNSNKQKKMRKREADNKLRLRKLREESKGYFMRTRIRLSV